MHINPDHYLETEQGRVFTQQRNKEAWAQCFQDLEHQFQSNAKLKKIYILIGAQGSGKTTWAISKNKDEPYNIVFDAILVKKQERRRIIERAQHFHIDCIAVYFDTSLEQCLSRNAKRSPDTHVNETALSNVYRAIERPTLDEGFTEIIISETQII